MNKVVLMGRLTKDPELKYTPSNVAVTTFTVAVDRNYARQGEQRQTDFINIVAWRTTAEFVAKYFSKGQLMALSGSIQTRTWDDNEGKRHYVTEVVADEVYFAEGKRDNSGTSYQAPTPAEAPAPQQTMPQSPDFEISPDDDDLPF
ncbi:MAG: single-stranded DNA-binding protein [Clostridia bacterium]|nr:single-stranded DNA-binding protein [Clostridia bacterium]